jgi:hypothetical protein
MSEQWDGRPQNPEQSGMHLLRSRLTGHLTGWYWNATTERFHHEHVTLGRAALLERYVYEGLIHTPAEVSALVEAARREEREACAAVVDCGCDNREAVLARLESQGEKRASYLCTHGDVCCAIQAAAIRARGDA